MVYIEREDRFVWNKKSKERFKNMYRGTITPGEAAIISADIAIKSGSIELGFLDRFSGTLLLTGDFASVESSLKAVLAFLQGTLKFYICEITRS